MAAIQTITGKNDMINEWLQTYTAQLQTFFYLLMIVNGIIHVIFAGAVARDGGNLYQLNQRPALVSATTWAFATLLGGVFVAAIYWLIHHSTFTRPSLREYSNERKTS